MRPINPDGNYGYENILQSTLYPTAGTREKHCCIQTTDALSNKYY